jgi:hypothetical protein
LPQAALQEVSVFEIAELASQAFVPDPGSFTSARHFVACFQPKPSVSSRSAGYLMASYYTHGGNRMPRSIIGVSLGLGTATKKPLPVLVAEGGAEEGRWGEHRPGEEKHHHHNRARWTSILAARKYRTPIGSRHLIPGYNVLASFQASACIFGSDAGALMFRMAPRKVVIE